MTNENKRLGKILKQQRVMIPLTLQELARASGVSPSYLGRVERGQCFPSARVLRKIAKPLKFSESELLASAGYLSFPPGTEVRSPGGGRLDPNVAGVLSQEPVEIQRGVVTILSLLASMAEGIGFREYMRRNYPEVDEDLITMMEDLIERGREVRIHPR